MSDRDGKPDRSPTDDAELAARLRALDRRLDERRAESAGGSPGRSEAPRQGMALAMRLAADFVAGVVLGAALGWGFDRLFGTSPWGLMVFLLLGFAAGILSVMRSAGVVKPGPMGPDDGAPTGADEEDDVATDPIHQFHIEKLIPIEVGGVDFSFTNSALFMVLTVAVASGFLLIATRRRALVPSRWQSSAEVLYEFMAQTLRESAGSEGMRFFPFVFSIFLFFLFGNSWGLIPYFFTYLGPHHRHRCDGAAGHPDGARLWASCATSWASSACSCRRTCRSFCCRSSS